MDTKKILKIVKVIVEAEVAKKQVQFLERTLPNIIKEEIDSRMKILLEEKGGVPPSSMQIEEDEVDPFLVAEQALNQERSEPKKQFTKNAILNEVLNNTKPFSKDQRSATPGGGASVLDKFQEPVNESMDKTLSFNSQGAQGGIDMMRTQMTQKMGYGNVKTQPTKSGLGVQTGLAGLDRILNRDNSELVKKFKR